MDNPFRTAPGSEPPALVGRDREAAAASYSFSLTRAGAPAQPIIFTGLRGMGKTALLRHTLTPAKDDGAVIVFAEASPYEPLAASLRTGLEQARRENASLPQRLQGGLEKLVSLLPRTSLELPNDMGAVTLERRDEPELPFVEGLTELNELARQHARFLVFAIDEIQDTPPHGMRDLVRFVHASASSQRPAYLIGAGLPNSKEHLHEVRTYTERWRYFRLGLLSETETAEAIVRPLADRGVTIEPTALRLLVAESAGYPFFIQEYAAAAWMQRTGTTITAEETARTIPGVRAILEDDFYDARFRRLSPRECEYVLAMAELGPGAHTTGEVAARFKLTSDKLSSIRAQLIRKDMIYSPAVGMTEFRIPLTERYIEQRRDDLQRRARESSVRRTLSRD